jgi:hypothetical protein
VFGGHDRGRELVEFVVVDLADGVDEVVQPDGRG